MFHYRPTPLQRIDLPQARQRNVDLFIKREDLVHQAVSGNKWHKLALNIEQAKQQWAKTLVSVGGAYSNHIHALAWAANEFGFESVGIIRGEEDQLSLSPTLQDAQRWGMKLIAVNRANYRQRHTQAFQQQYMKGLQSPYWIPEGGSNDLAVQGVAYWVTGFLAQQECFDEIWLPVGSGGTMAGVLKAVSTQTQVVGVAALPQMAAQKALFNGYSNWRVECSAHCGGYAKFDRSLVAAMDAFERHTGIPLEPVYSGKMVYAFMQALNQGQLDNKRVMFIHTGGLQGLRGTESQLAELRA